MPAHGLDWRKHEAEIFDLYVNRGMTLKAVMTYMEENHGFKATSVISKICGS